MKKSAILVSIIMLLSIFLSWDIRSNSTQPPLGRTGAPAEQTCVNGCHTGGSGTGSVSVIFGTGQTAYFPDSSYAVTVTVTDPSKTRFGFEAVALDGSDNNAGSCMVVNPSTTGTMSAAGRSYVFHKSAGSTNSWQFLWTAPSSNVGTVTFYAAGNAANNDGNSTGDNIYTASLSVTPDSSVGMQEKTAPGSLGIYPNPAPGSFYVRLPAPADILVYSQDGRMVHRVLDAVPESGNVFRVVAGQDMPDGVYYVQVISGRYRTLDKVFIRE